MTGNWMDRMWEIFLDPNRKNWGEAFSLKNTHFPEKLFRYRPPADWSINELREGTVRLSSAGSMNDPFDCSLIIDADRLTERIVRGSLSNPPYSSMIPEEERSDILKTAHGHKEIFERMRPFATGDAARHYDALIDVIYTVSAKQAHDIANVFNKSLHEETKVCSFSENNRNLAMWSHYTRDHMGFCVEYFLSDIPTTDRIRRVLYPVVYSDNRFDMFDWLSPSPNRPSPATISVFSATRKSLDWQYEREWRLAVSLGASPSFLTWKMPRPSAVYIGCRIKEEPRADLLAIAREHAFPLFEMRMSPSRYAVEPHPLLVA